MINPKRPDEVLENISPNEKGLIDLPEAAFVEGTKYSLQNMEGTPIKNTIHVKPENLENYVYVPVSGTSPEESDQGKAGDEETQQDTVSANTQTMAEELLQSNEDVAAETIANNLEATTALRSYFRNFLGINPEDFAKVVTKLRSRPNGDIVVANATQHYIGAKIGERLAKEGVELKDTFELVDRLNMVNPHTSLPEYYSTVFEAYKELGYDSGVAKRLSDSFFDFIGDAHVMGVFYAMRSRESNFGLTWAKVYNKKLQKSGKDAELYSAQKMRQIHTKLTSGTAEPDKIAQNIAEIFEEEFTATTDASANLYEDYKKKIGELVEDLVASANSTDITIGDINATKANLLRVDLGGRAVFSAPNVGESLEYAVHKAYVAYHGENSLTQMQNYARNALSKLDSADAIQYLDAIKEFQLENLDNSDTGEISGELIGSVANSVFSDDGIFSENAVDAEVAQKRLITLGLLTYAKNNGLALGAKWNAEQYAEAIQFIKDNFSLASVISDYLAMPGTYDPTTFLEGAAKTMAAARYAYGIDSIDVAYQHLSDIRADTNATPVLPSPADILQETTEAIEAAAAEEPAAPSSDVQEGEQPKGEKAEQQTESTKEEDAALGKGVPRLHILPSDPLTKLYEGDVLTLKDKHGEPLYSLQLNDDGDMSVHTASGEEFTLSPEETFWFISKFTDMEAAETQQEELDIYYDIAQALAEAKVKHTAPEGALEAAEAFAETVAGTGDVQEEDSESQLQASEEDVAEDREDLESGTKPEELEKKEAGKEEQTQEVQEALENIAEKHEETQEFIDTETEPVSEAAAEEVPEVEQEPQQATEEGESEEQSMQPVSEQQEVTRDTTPTGLTNSTKQVLEKILGTKFSDKTNPVELNNSFINAYKNQEFIKKLGMSKPIRDAMNIATQLSGQLTFSTAGQLALGNYLSTMLDNDVNSTIAKNNIDLPNNRKTIVIPRAATVNGEPGVVLETRNKDGKLVRKKEIPVSKLDKKDLDKISKYMAQLQKYVPAYKKLAEEVLHDQQIVNTLARDWNKGRFARMERLAPKMAEDVNNNLGLSENELHNAASDGHYPLLNELYYKYNIPGLYLPQRYSATGKYMVTSPESGGGTIETDTYDEAVDKLVEALDRSVQKGEYPENIANTIKQAIKKDRELQAQFKGKIPKSAAQEVESHVNRVLEKLVKDLHTTFNTKLESLALSPKEYVNDKFVQTLEMLSSELNKEGEEELQKELSGEKVSEQNIKNAIAIFGKYIPGLQEILQQAYTSLLHDAEQHTQRWEAESKEKEHEQKVRAENYGKITKLKKEASDTYDSLWDRFVRHKRKVSAKTALRRITEALKKIEDNLNESARLSNENVERNALEKAAGQLKHALAPMGITVPDFSEVSSFADYAPYYLAWYNSARIRNQGKEAGITGADEIVNKLRKANATEQPTTKKDKEKESKAEEAPTKAEQPKEVKENIPSQETAGTKTSSKPGKVPSQSNVDAVFNTLIEKYANGKKAPTEGRVKRAIRTQLSKLFENPETALNTLNEYFNTSAETYDDLLSELAQKIVDTYDERRAEKLKEAAKKAKESTKTSEETLPSGFDANAIRQGLANFVENYPIPPKAVDDLLNKYGTDFSKWSPEALEELGTKLRDTLGHTSIGQSIQEFFPKGFVVNEPEPEEEKTDELENGKDLEDIEGPTEEDLEGLDEEE